MEAITDYTPATEDPAGQVYIVDDDPSVRDALHMLLRSAGFRSRCCASTDAFLAALELDRPGCVILDLRLPGKSGLELQRELRGQGCSIPIIFVSGHGTIRAAVRAMQAGAYTFLTKPVDDETLLDQVHQALQASCAQLDQQQQTQCLAARFDTLTQREHEVLAGIVYGLSNKQVARKLGISHKTVELHRAHVMQKMEADSLPELVRMTLDVRADPEGRSESIEPDDQPRG